MRQTAIAFSSGKLSLEGVLSVPQGGADASAALLVCHPHPVLGGNMENPVVTALCRAADGRGLAALRFNFRGVGDSAGEFAGGDGEQQDIKAALNVLRRWPGVDGKRLALAGYSFGASVILGGLKHCKQATCLALIAPPVSAVRSSPILSDKRPKLFLAGQRDRIVPSVDLQRALDDMRPPVQFAEIEGAGHSFGGREQAVAERVVSFVAEILAAGPPPLQSPKTNEGDRR